MKRYEIEERDLLNIDIDGFVRLSDSETGESVAAVYVDVDYNGHGDPAQVRPESARRLRRFAASEAMEEFVKAITGPSSIEGMRIAASLGKAILNYIETGEEV